MIITNASLLHLRCRIITIRQWSKVGQYWQGSDRLKLKLTERLVYRPFTNSTRKANMCLLGKKDRFNTITVDLANWENKEFISDICAFSKMLSDSTLKWQKEGTVAIWLRVPIMHSGLIPVAAGQKFELHHTEGDFIYLSRWLLDCPSRLPTYANHHIGVAGLVLNEDKQEVLMIQDKHKTIRWKFPGGLSHFQEDIPDTAMREVLEETGIKTEFQSILCFRQQHNMPWTFGVSDIYVICRLRPLNFDINMCPDELLDAKWMKIEELQNPNNTHLSIRVAHLIQYGLINGFHTVDMTMEELPSIYKNVTYKLFHKPIPLS